MSRAPKKEAYNVANPHTHKMNVAIGALSQHVIEIFFSLNANEGLFFVNIHVQYQRTAFILVPSPVEL